MAYRVKITSPAEHDIDEIVAYIFSRSPQNAAEWVNGIFEKIFSLEQMPARCPVAPESEKIGRKLRSLLYQSHRIIFDIDEEQRLVRILRVWHSAQDEIKGSDLQE